MTKRSIGNLAVRQLHSILKRVVSSRHVLYSPKFVRADQQRLALSHVRLRRHSNWRGNAVPDVINDQPSERAIPFGDHTNLKLCHPELSRGLSNQYEMR